VVTEAVADDTRDEDAGDIRAAAEARAEMAETGARPIPRDEIKTELRL